MLYIASVEDKRTKKIGTIKSEYSSKLDFAEDLRRNGYSIRFIATEKSFDYVCEKYHNRLKNNAE